MPTRAPHPCAKPGCPTLVQQGSYCPEHEATRRHRDAESQRFYNSTFWKNLRAFVKRNQPVCAICHARPSKVVDHIDGDWKNNTLPNLRGLCVECERTRTAKQHREKARR